VRDDYNPATAELLRDIRNMPPGSTSAEWVAATEAARLQQVIADLQAAREELAARGRCVHKFADGEKVCALGALGVAAVEGFLELTEQHQEHANNREPRMVRARLALEQHLPEVGGHLELTVNEFNDDPETTDEDVLNLFDKTLADLGGLA
jgi:hypothetical protein